MNYVIVLVFVAIMKIQQDDVFGNDDDDHGKAGFQGKASQKDDHVIMMVIVLTMRTKMTNNQRKTIRIQKALRFPNGKFWDGL